ncbi:helix-turn-helix domain-containing protein [Cupriavidus necator]
MMTLKQKARADDAEPVEPVERPGSVRQYLQDHPEVVARLLNRTLLAKDLASQLGVHHNTVSKALSKIDRLIHTGGVAQQRKAASAEKLFRTVHLRSLAEMVHLGRYTVDEAAEIAGVSKATIYRYLRKLEAREGTGKGR